MSGPFPKEGAETLLGQAAEALSRAAPDWLCDRVDAPRKERRILALGLPRFAMERWQIMADRRGDTPPADMPIALSYDTPRGAVIHATNAAAEEAGVTVGARTVDMRALCPALHLDYADLDGDRKALERLMLWCRRWAPWTTLDGTDGIVMDATGCAHLFGGEEAMLLDIEHRLAMLGMSSVSALAPTHGAAWALARFGPVRARANRDTLSAALRPLPTRALRLNGETVLLLNRLGLKTVGDVMDVPRVPLARRFARASLEANPPMRLDQATGRLPEPLDAPEDPPRFIVDARLPEPVMDPADWLPRLSEDLCADLEAAGFGARRLTLTVYRTDGEVSWVTVGTSLPNRDPRHVCRLFDGKLEGLVPGYGFDLITLAAPQVEEMGKLQERLDGKASSGTELAQAVDRLVARFGPHRVERPGLQDKHIPERAETWRPALAGTTPVPDVQAGRPTLLLDRPEEIRVLYAVPEGPPAQFVWRKQVHKVGRYDGPERIAPEWWIDNPGTRLRDYYRVEEQHGLRFWIYREGVMGDARGREPMWFIHGLYV